MPHYFPAVRYGGPIRSVQGLAAATAALGHDVHVYTTNVDGPGVSDVPTGLPVVIDGVAVWYFPSGLGRKIFRSPALGRSLEETIKTFDIVHIHYMWVWTTICAAAIARRHCVPYILAPRGMLVADLIRRRSGFAKRAWLGVFGRHDIRCAAAIHVTSDVEATDFTALRLSARRVVIIPNGVDALQKQEGISMWGELGTSANGGRPYVLFLGRLSWKKGLDRLVRAFVTVPNADLVIAGYDEGGYQLVIERLVSEGQIGDRVRFVGPVEGAIKQMLVANASCVVLPSYNENFGMVVVEAMAAGRPVVVTPEVGLANVVEGTGSGIVAQGDPAAIAAALNFILRNPTQARGMGEAGRTVVQQRYGWDTVARDVQQLYEECCASLPPDGR